MPGLLDTTTKASPSQRSGDDGVLGRHRQVILAAVSGLILGLSMPLPGWWPLAWVGLVPLFVAIRDVRPGRAALLGLVTGMVYCGFFARWLFIFGTLPWFAVITFQALYIALFAALYARVSRLRPQWLPFVLVPAAWVSVQFVKSLGVSACTWGSLAHTQANFLPAIQIAAVTGSWGIDFVVCLVNFAIGVAVTDRARSRTALVVAGAVMIAALGFGTLSLATSPPAKDGHRVAILQGNMYNHGNLPNYPRRVYERYLALTLEAAEHKPDIILWPETAIPTTIQSPGWADEIAGLANRAGSWVLMGGYDLSADPGLRGYYNALLAFSDEGQQKDAYHKAHLVPFGEFVPFRDYLTFLKRYHVRVDDVLPAETHDLIDTPIGKLGTSICFESTFSQIAGVETRNGAEVLVVASNDAWFEGSSATYQHFAAARLRAVENRRFLLRAASTGISAVIDPYGRVRHKLGVSREGMIMDTVVPSRTLTLYSRFADWLAYLCLPLTAICLFISPRKPEKHSRRKRRR